uniref:Hexose transporter 1 n=1 Tax=Mucochytrium quahogii TaxID=96639 RepID=A0A7S2W538_9STRA
MISHDFGWGSILLGRVVSGLGNGFLLSSIPVYASELAPANYRGKALTMFQLNIVIGILLMALLNKVLSGPTWGWRIAFTIQSVPCATIILMTAFVLPESPRFLVQNGKRDQARQAIEKLCRGSPNAQRLAETELRDIELEVEEYQSVGEGSFKELFQGPGAQMTLCAVTVTLATQITGINWFINYATQLFSDLGLDAFTFDIYLKLVNMVFTITTLFLVERFGRKFLTVWGSVFILLAFLLNSIVIYATGVDLTDDNPSSKTKSVQMFTLSMIFMYMAAYAATLGTLGWLIPSEVFTLRLRGKGMSLSIAANMLGNIVFGDYGYVNFNSVTSIEATMVLLVFLNFFFVFLVYIFLQPETKGTTLEEIRKVFGYEYNGNEKRGHGTLKNFYVGNASEALQILRCRAVDPHDRFPKNFITPETPGSP